MVTLDFQGQLEEQGQLAGLVEQVLQVPLVQLAQHKIQVLLVSQVQQVGLVRQVTLDLPQILELQGHLEQRVGQDLLV